MLLLLTGKKRKKIEVSVKEYELLCELDNNAYYSKNTKDIQKLAVFIDDLYNRNAAISIREEALI